MATARTRTAAAVKWMEAAPRGVGVLRMNGARAAFGYGTALSWRSAACGGWSERWPHFRQIVELILHEAGTHWQDRVGQRAPHGRWLERRQAGWHVRKGGAISGVRRVWDCAA